MKGAVFFACAIAMVGCSGKSSLSSQYQSSGREVYELLQSGLSGAAVSRHDIDVAMSRAKARTSNLNDQLAQAVLGEFYSAISNAACAGRIPSPECTPLEKAAFESCEAEAAKYFSQTGMPMGADFNPLKEPNYGDCSKASLAASEQMVREMSEPQVADPIKCKDWNHGLKPEYRHTSCPYTVARSRADYMVHATASK